MRKGDIETLHILLVLVLPGGEVTTHRGRIGTRCAGQHIVLVGVEGIELNAQLATPERSIDTDVVVQVLLPRDVGIGHRRGVDALLTHTANDYGVAAREVHRIEVLVGTHGRRTRQTDTATELQVVHPLGTKPLLLRDTPTGRCSGEEAPARTAHTREEVRTVVTTRQLDVEAVVEVIVQTCYETHLARAVAHTANGTLVARGVTEVQLRQILEHQIVHTAVVVVGLVVARLNQRESSHAVLAEGVVIRERGLRNAIIGVVRSLLQRVLRTQTRIGVAHRVVNRVDVAVLVIRELTQSQLIRGRKGLRVLEGHIIRSEEFGRQTLHPGYIPAQRNVGLDKGGAALERTRLLVGGYGVHRGRSGRRCGVVLHAIHHHLFRHVGVYTHRLLGYVVPGIRVGRVGRLVVVLNTACNTHLQREVLGNLGREVGTCRVATEVEVIDVTLLVEHTHRSEVVHIVVATVGRNGVRHGGTHVEDLVVPVGVAPTILLVEHLLHDVGREDGLLTIQLQCLVVPIGVARTVQKLHRVGICADTERTLVRDGGFTLLTALGRHDDNRVTIQTIDGSGRSILQNRNRLDILGIDLVDVTRHTIDDVKHRLATYHNRRAIGTRLTRSLHGRHTGHTTGQHVRYVAHRGLLKLLARDLRDGRRHRGLLLYTVTYDHHFVNLLGVVLKLHLQIRYAIDRDGHGLITDERNLQDALLLQVLQ